jgi:hypothetical protein
MRIDPRGQRVPRPGGGNAMSTAILAALANNGAEPMPDASLTKPA